MPAALTAGFHCRTANLVPSSRDLFPARALPPRRAFFQETHELYVKVLMDPFYTPGSRIVGRDFDERVRALARRYLGVR